MVTAVDSSVLVDVLTGDPIHGQASLVALRAARNKGALVACPVVWAEVRALFAAREQMVEVFENAQILFDPFDRECADVAGEAWIAYRKAGGSRTRLLADFLVGAHAQVRGGRLLTRDRGFYRKCFTGLEVLEPQS